MAIIMISLTFSALTVPLLISVGTRLNHRRIQQANHTSQLLIERARVAMANETDWVDGVAYVPPPSTPANAPGVDIPVAEHTTVGDISAVGIPTAECTSTTNYCSNVLQVKAFDVDSDGDTDFYIQAFRGNKEVDNSDGTNQVVGFDMGVRVYPSGAASYLGDTTNPLFTETAAAGISATGVNPRYPLTVSYTTLYRSEGSTSLCGIGTC
jgi:type II secretory pathway pseudopilin PulG